MIYVNMKLAIVGSRSFTNYELLQINLLRLFPVLPSEIISGGAMGADTLAERFATAHAIKLTVHDAAWSSYGRRAGYLRNETIVQAADVIVAFWDGKSPGTKLTIDLARRYNKQVIVIQI